MYCKGIFLEPAVSVLKIKTSRISFKVRNLKRIFTTSITVQSYPGFLSLCNEGNKRELIAQTFGKEETKWTSYICRSCDCLPRKSKRVYRQAIKIIERIHDERQFSMGQLHFWMLCRDTNCPFVWYYFFFLIWTISSRMFISTVFGTENNYLPPEQKADLLIVQCIEDNVSLCSIELRILQGLCKPTDFMGSTPGGLGEPEEPLPQT